MAAYTPEQIYRYLAHIGWDGDEEPGSLAHLTRLVQLHLVAVPFENLWLHYSQSHSLSLDLDVLYDKVVDRTMGGYCTEVNSFFAAILRGLGYTLIHGGGRVSDATAGQPGGGFQAWNHAFNLVMVDGTRYLVDVGFGANTPCRPVPLRDGIELTGMAPQQFRLQYKVLPQHTDRDQRVWVYGHRDGPDNAWTEGYCFTEIEYFAADFEIMNAVTMTLRNSLFTQAVICVRFLRDPYAAASDLNLLHGAVVLFNDEVKTKVRGKLRASEKFSSENDRVGAIEREFGIRLVDRERRGITGLVTQLRPRPAA